MVGFDSLLGKLGELIQKHGIKQIYLETEQLSVAQARRFEASFQKVGAEVVLDDTLDSAIRDQRMIKSPEEVKKIEASQEITDAAFTHILPFIKEGVTERELALEIEFFMRKQGAEGIAFPPIVAAGKNGSQCHAVPSDNQVHSGDFITMDTGALLDGYNSDMTRTVALGKVSEEQKAVYDTVLKAHLAVIDQVKPGCLAAMWTRSHGTSSKRITPAPSATAWAMGLALRSTSGPASPRRTPPPVPRAWSSPTSPASISRQNTACVSRICC